MWLTIYVVCVLVKVNVDKSWKMIGTTLAWTKHERLTGRNEARKRLRTWMHERLRTWMHEVSDFRNHFLFCLSNVVLVN
uniref:Uncharacterized protein n=1 Tax=Helianthus annuus TaxID=4232 RepID=A0A251TJC2_HELAN